MDAFPDEKGIYRLGDHKEDLYSEIYRSTWLKVLGKKLEALGDSREDFGKRCNLVRQAYMEMGDIVLKAAREGASPRPISFLGMNSGERARRSSIFGGRSVITVGCPSIPNTLF